MTRRLPGIRGLRLAGPMLIVVAVLAPVRWASSAGLSLEQRVERLERIVSGPGMVNMLSQIQALQQQIQQLTGRQDELQHKLDNLQRHQRDLYLDIDQRLRRLELKSVTPGSAGVAPSSPIPAAPSPGAVGAGAAAGAATLQVQSD